jgi:hypothetical protein
MTLRSADQFDNFRKERKRMQAKLGPQPGALGYDNKALRELEEVEAKEIHEQRLTREVHEFFATATRQAASIVERVAKSAEAETGARVEQEMEAFLIDALSRMNTFVVTALQQRRAPVAETDMEPRLGRIVGQSLDDFRWEGTADIGDKHIGQDPFDTDVEEVQREFRAQMGDVPEAPASVPIDEHLVASVDDDEMASRYQSDEETTDEGGEPEAANDGGDEAGSAPEERREPAPRPAPATPSGSSVNEELERFKSALGSLVRAGTMSKDEARAAWRTRLAALGR